MFDLAELFTVLSLSLPVREIACKVQGTRVYQSQTKRKLFTGSAFGKPRYIQITASTLTIMHHFHHIIVFVNLYFSIIVMILYSITMHFPYILCIEVIVHVSFSNSVINRTFPLMSIGSSPHKIQIIHHH